jgi:TRAP-type C4-dicarboxylate transport system permease small subunit
MIMQATKLIGILLIVAGTLGLAYGGFSYTEESTAAKIGTLEITVDQEKEVNVPMWAGVGAIVAGAFLLLVGGRRR